LVGSQTARDLGEDRADFGARTFRYDACGLVRDREEHAARNLSALVAAVAGSDLATENARGRDGRPAGRRAAPAEAGSPQGLRPATGGYREPMAMFSAMVPPSGRRGT